jgi:hypothetical protein
VGDEMQATVFAAIFLFGAQLAITDQDLLTEQENRHGYFFKAVRHRELKSQCNV